MVKIKLKLLHPAIIVEKLIIAEKIITVEKVITVEVVMEPPTTRKKLEMNLMMGSRIVVLNSKM